MDIRKVKEFSYWLQQTTPRRIFKLTKMFERIPKEIIIDGDRYFSEDFEIEEIWEQQLKEV